jgi:hypothetical protein
MSESKNMRLQSMASMPVNPTIQPVYTLARKRFRLADLFADMSEEKKHKESIGPNLKARKFDNETILSAR